MRKAKVFTGSSHQELAALVVEKLGIPSAPAIVTQFDNKEISLEVILSFHYFHHYNIIQVDILSVLMQDEQIPHIRR